MAYMNQEIKSGIVAKVKPILDKYGVKATFSVRNRHAISVNINSGKLDFIGNYSKVIANNPKYADRSNAETKSLSINQYWYHEHFDGQVSKFITEVIDAIKKGGDWYDKSDIQSDYFNTAFYFDINVGNWNKPYKLVA